MNAEEDTPKSKGEGNAMVCRRWGTCGQNIEPSIALPQPFFLRAMGCLGLFLEAGEKRE